MTRYALTNAVWYADIGVRAVLVSRLFLSGLWRSYPAFFTAMNLGIARSVVFALMRHSRTVYYVTDPVLWLCAVAMCYEAFHKLTDHYPGIESFAKKLVTALLGAAILLVSLTAGVDDLSGNPMPLRVEVTIRRYVITGCALFLLGAVLFLSRLNRPWRRNRIHVTLMAILFVSQAVGYWSGNSSASGIAFLFWNIALQAISLICYAVWSVCLTVEGEEIPPVPRTLSDADLADALAAPDRLMKFIDEKTPRAAR